MRKPRRLAEENKNSLTQDVVVDCPGRGSVYNVPSRGSYNVT